MEAEAEAVARFVAQREVEAPDFFQAIQSHRAAMAVLRQLAAFTGELYQSGAVDEGERETVLGELGKRERRLEITGARGPGRGGGARGGTCASEATASRGSACCPGPPSRRHAPHARRLHTLPPPGPVWKPPRPGAVLRCLPFLRCLPRPRLERLLAQGRLLGALGA